jgi:serine/arginine repetitive matrix protein 2
VDGLRAAGEDYEGDDIPAFPRLSRNSEYSAQDTHELRFREHQRTASKASTTSTMTKLGKQSQSNRPETRVYFSSAGDIGTLVDSLTKNTEAGQFNIIPGIPSAIGSLRPQSGAQSARSLNGSYNSSLPDGDWTLEERIDQMIAASRKRAGL